MYVDQNDYFTIHGELDEALIYDCALPADDILSAAAGRAATVDVANENRDCLMHWFRFNEDTGATVLNEGRFDGLEGYIVDPLGNQVYRENSVLP